MRMLLSDPDIGDIVYQESFWTGRKTVCINGGNLLKVDKNMFALNCEGEKSYVIVKGNMFTGILLEIKGKDFVVSPKPEWYELALAVLTFVITMIWGNSTALCSIIPIVGGAIGGAISGLMSVLSLALMKQAREVWKKLLIGFGMLIATFLVCFIIGIALLALVV